MKHKEIVTEVFSALERKNWEKVSSRLTENFTFRRAVPQAIKKNDWVGVQKAIQSGMPDLKFNLHQVVVRGNKILAKVKLSGTHTAELPVLPDVILKSIPSTGKKIELPEEEIEFSFVGDKISDLYVKPVEHGGIKGILEQLDGEERTDYLE